jgi:outer membrane protein assembly factor BamD (BamD/ComL family)
MTLLVCLLLLVCPQAVSQEQQSLDRYYEQAREAIDAENYETAVRIIEEGKQRFPDAAKLNLLLADLYYDKELYTSWTRGKSCFWKPSSVSARTEAST